MEENSKKIATSRIDFFVCFLVNVRAGCVWEHVCVCVKVCVCRRGRIIAVVSKEEDGCGGRGRR